FRLAPDRGSGRLTTGFQNLKPMPATIYTSYGSTTTAGPRVQASGEDLKIREVKLVFLEHTQFPNRLPFSRESGGFLQCFQRFVVLAKFLVRKPQRVGLLLTPNPSQPQHGMHVPVQGLDFSQEPVCIFRVLLRSSAARKAPRDIERRVEILRLQS